MLIVSQRAFGGEVTMMAECGETLFWEGDPCAHVLELRSGIVRGVSISEEGERQVTAFFFTGDQIGIPVTPSYRYSAEAISGVSYVSHPKGRWCDSMIESFRRDGRLLQSIGAEQDPVFRRGMLIGRNGALARTAAFLTSIADRLEADSGSLRFPVPQRDIAAYLALTPETVCRSLKRLREMGVIKMPCHDRLIVLDRSGLELAAHSLLED